MSESVIRVLREGQYAYAGRKFRVLIDGREAGFIHSGDEKEFRVEPGAHTVQVRVDWYRSPEAQVTVTAGEAIALRCGASGTMGFSAKMFSPGDYLFLEATEDLVPAPPPALAFVGVRETERSEEPIGDERRTVDNSSSTVETTRRFSMSRTWRREVVLGIDETDRGLTEGKVGFDASSLRSLAERSLSKKYSLSESRSETYTEEVEVAVGRNLELTVHFHWKRFWQHGFLDYERPDGTILALPFKIVSGISFDQVQSTRPQVDSSSDAS